MENRTRHLIIEISVAEPNYKHHRPSDGPEKRLGYTRFGIDDPNRQIVGRIGMQFAKNHRVFFDKLAARPLGGGPGVTLEDVYVKNTPDPGSHYPDSAPTPLIPDTGDFQITVCTKEEHDYAKERLEVNGWEFISGVGAQRKCELAPPLPRVAQADTETDFGMPNSTIRFKIRQASAASTSCARTCRARSLPPRICLYRKKVFSTRP